MCLCACEHVLSKSGVPAASLVHLTRPLILGVTLLCSDSQSLKVDARTLSVRPVTCWPQLGGTGGWQGWGQLFVCGKVGPSHRSWTAGWEEGPCSLPGSCSSPDAELESFKSSCHTCTRGPGIWQEKGPPEATMNERNGGGVSRATKLSPFIPFQGMPQQPPNSKEVPSGISHVHQFLALSREGPCKLLPQCMAESLPLSIWQPPESSFQHPPPTSSAKRLLWSI